MTAAITDAYRKVALNALKDDVSAANNNYYVAIGRSLEWENAADSAPRSADSDISSVFWVNSARDVFQSYKIVQKAGLVVPRVDWKSDTIYAEVDDKVEGNATPFYVMNDNLRVYAVLNQPKTITGLPIASTVKPSGVLPLIKTADGYCWQYLYQVGPEDANAFLTTNFMPVQHINSDLNPAVTAVEFEQDSLQNSALANLTGSILNIQVDDGGTYTSAPTVSIIGDGSGASATAVYNGGAITHIKMDSDGNGVVSRGTGYTRATIAFAGGGETVAATARAVISNVAFGANPTNDLNASSLMMNSRIDGTESGEITAENDYRQISLVKNPKQYGNSSNFTEIAGKAMKGLSVQTLTNPFTYDELISSSSASGYYHSYDAGSGTLYYYQTEETGYSSFSAGETVTSVSGSAILASPSFFVAPDVDVYSGDVLYIDNKGSVTRSDTQIEDVKIVIQL